MRVAQSPTLGPRSAQKIIGTLAAMLCTLVAAVAMFFLTFNDSAAYVDCRSAQCKEAREYLRSLVNPAVDPCLDFYSYVCGSWLNGGGSFLEDNVNATLGRIARVVQNTALDGRDKKGTHVLRDVYEACTEYVADENAELETLLTAANELLSLETLRQATTFVDIAHFVVKTSLEAGLHTFVSIDMVNEKGLALLHLSFGDSLVRRFGDVKDSTDALRIVRKTVLTFPIPLDDPETVSKLAVLDNDISDIANSYKRNTDAVEVSLMEALNGTVGESDVQLLMDHANKILPPSRTLTVSATMLTTGLNEVKQAFGVVMQAGVRTASLYLLTYLTAYVIWADTTRQRVKADRIQTALFCLRMTSHCLTGSWPQLLASFVGIPPETVGVAKSLFTEAQNASARRGVFAWITEAGRKAFIEAVSGIGTVVLPQLEETTDYSGFQHVSVQATVNDSASRRFALIYTLARKHDRRLQLAHPPTRGQALLTELGHIGQVSVAWPIRAVLVPGMYLAEPYSYVPRVKVMPDYFNHGTLGVLLAEEVAGIAGPEGAAAIAAAASPSEGDGDGVGWWDTFTANNYDDTVSCLMHLHYDLGFRNNASGSLLQQQRELFKRAQGLRLAYNALLKHFRDESPDYDVFTTHWPEAEWTFFVRSCLMECSANQTPNPLTPRERCMLPLHNMDEFAGTFKCRRKPNFVKARCIL